MADQPQEQNSQAQPQFAIQKIYVKDISFETPNSPEVFNKEWKPQINVEIDTKGREIADDVHEIVLGVTVTAKFEDTVAFLVEVQQAGIFVIKNFQDAEKGMMIGSYCPSLLFPYVREVVSDIVTKGGFPQFLLQPVNFDALYQQHLSRVKNQEQATDTDSDKPVH